jgi:hypothetical protein
VSMNSPQGEGESPETASRWALIRDLLTFQLKLAIDAFRDLLLVPVSLAAGIFDLMTGGERPGERFYAVIRLGRRSERWINLFGTVEDPKEDDLPSLDALVGQVERRVVEQVAQGGMTASAKQAIDRSLDRLSEGVGPRSESSRSEDRERAANDHDPERDPRE